MAQDGSGYLARPAPSGLADVVEIILDKGIVIDAYVRVSLLGIELLSVDARAVVASVDTYLRFAEATNRLELAEQGGKDLADLLTEGAGAATEKVAGHMVERKVERVVEPARMLVDSAADKVEELADKVLPDPE